MDGIEGYEFVRITEGVTYKIKPGYSDHAFFITINSTQLTNGSYIPIEIFVNSKNMPIQMWVTALVTFISYRLRDTKDPLAVADSLKRVHDPANGFYYWKGKKVISLVAHLGILIETRFKEMNRGTSGGH